MARGFIQRALGLLVVLGLGTGATRAGPAEFLAAYHQEVVADLQAIHAHAMTPHERFLILSTGGPQRYVQCLFHDQDTAIFCEAGSGFYDPPPVPPLGLTPKALKVIADEGFTGSAKTGNYKLDRPVRDATTIAEVADLMLRTLYGGYGARLDRPVFVAGPFLCSGGEPLPAGHRLIPDEQQFRFCGLPLPSAPPGRPVSPGAP